MEDCGKFKKRFYLGLFLIALTLLFEMSKGFGDYIDIVIILLLSVSGLNLMMPHLRCLSKFKRSIK